MHAWLSPCVLLRSQDKRLNIWSTTSGKHIRAYKVEPSTTAPTAKPTPAASSVHSAVDGAGGSSTGRGGTDKGGAGGELFKVDLDPTGMYAAACSFDKVCGFVRERVRFVSSTVEEEPAGESRAERRPHLPVNK